MSYGSESHDAKFHLINGYPGDAIPASLEDPFTLRAAAVTDLWRKTPKVETYNAPSLVKTIRVEDFKSARVTVSAGWVRVYDQGGLVLYFHDSKLNAGDGDKIAKYGWVKTGVEFYEGRANLSTVATHPTGSSDWSLVPLADGTTSVTIEVERETKDETGAHGGRGGGSLWVYLIKEDGKRTAVREVTWGFTGPTLELGAISSGVYTARPTKGAEGEGGALEVSYSNFSLKA